MEQMTEVERRAEAEAVCKPLRIVIPCNNRELGRAALHATTAIAGDLAATVTLAYVVVVPFPLPLDRPDVDTRHLLRELRDLADPSPIPIRILLVLARDKKAAFRRLIPDRSLVVLATRKRWWRTAEESLARALTREGHRVVLLKLNAAGAICEGDRAFALQSHLSQATREASLNHA